MSLGALIAMIDYTGVAADEFHDWYDTEHIPERLEVPGFLRAQRWVGAADDRLSVALYDLSDVSVLASPGYRAIGGENFSPWSKRILPRCKSFRRYEAVQLMPGDAIAPEGAKSLVIVGMNVAEAVEDEFNDWYNTEHLPGLAAVPGVLAARRYRAAGADPNYLAIYHFSDPSAYKSASWLEAAETPWTRQMRSHYRNHVVTICKPYSRQ